MPELLSLAARREGAVKRPTSASLIQAPFRACSRNSSVRKAHFIKKSRVIWHDRSACYATLPTMPTARGKLQFQQNAMSCEVAEGARGGTLLRRSRVLGYCIVVIRARPSAGGVAEREER